MSQVDFFTHRLLKEKAIERRLYQETILGTCCNANSLIILPTGLGKTIIAVLIAVSRLNKFPNSKIIFLAPTKPLISQHYSTFKSVMVLEEEEEELAELTGGVPPEKRGELFNQAKIIFYTPQTLQNDLISGIAHLEDVSLIIFDEAHRAQGEYAYNFIAAQYMKEGKYPLILGITASPGATQEKIDTVIENLYVKNIEIRTENSPDVVNYIQPIEVKWDKIKLPPEFQEIKELIERKYKQLLKDLKSSDYLDSYDISRVSKQDLLSAQTRIRKAINISANPTMEDYQLIATVAMAIRFSYMVELLGTQGLNSLIAYLTKLEKAASGKGSSRVMKQLVESSFFKELQEKARVLVDRGIDHPKYVTLQKYLQDQFVLNKSSRVIVFTQYRVTAQLITEKLNELESIKAVRFVGQQSKAGDKGLGQKEQLEILSQFRSGEYNVLVATSVAEEGLDIAECDLVVFYDVVPSEIRYVQRKGRTGRKRPGGVFILMAQGTRDEGYYWTAQRKQREMHRVLKEIQKVIKKKEREIDNNQTQIDKFLSKEKVDFEITVDHRESSSSLVKQLVLDGFKIKLAQLQVADYLIGSRILVERKTTQDFSKSIIDGRLFKEIKDLKETSPHPLLVIEGEDLYTASTLKPEAVRAACVSIMVDFNIPIIMTKNGQETGRYFATIARREMEKLKGKKIPITRIEKTPQKLSDIQEYVVAGLPSIDTVRAKRLLGRLKTLEQVFTAEEEDLVDIEGIGKTLANRIRKLITAKYRPEK